MPNINEILGTLDTFAHWSEADRRALSERLRLRRISAGTLFCRAGERGESCFILVEGVVLVYRDVPGRGRIELAPLKPGAIFGQASLFDGLPRMADCQTDGDCVVLELRREDHDALMISDKRLAGWLERELAKGLVRQLRMANQRLGEIEDIREDDRRDRFSELLLSLSS